MANPNSRETFKQYCLRRLGAPVIDINVAEEQIQDRIDEALSFYTDYSFDGTEKAYFKYQLQQQDLINKYIKLPDNIIGTVRFFPIGDPAVTSDNLFNIRYQIALNDLYTLTSYSMVPYFSVRQHLELFEQILVGEQPIRYNRKNNVLYLDMDWLTLTPGMYILVECYKIVDPQTYPKLWSDRWLQNLATAYIKKQWADNLSKFTGLSLPGGVQFNAQQLMQSALMEIQQAEKAIMDVQMPLENFVG